MMPAVPRTLTLPPAPSPIASRIAAVSAWAAGVVMRVDSSSLALTSASATSRQSPTDDSWSGTVSASRRWRRASSSVASRRARRRGPGRRARRTPRWPGRRRRLRTSWAATAAADGVRSRTSRQRDRMVGGRSSATGTQSRNTPARRRLLDGLEQRVGGGLGQPVGVLEQDDLPAAAPRRHRRAAARSRGPRPRRSTARPASRTSTSGWLPARTSWQVVAVRRSHRRGHCSAAANARAATERPDPGGPVNSQAWVNPCACSPRAASTACCELGDHARPGRPGRRRRSSLLPAAAATRDRRRGGGSGSRPSTPVRCAPDHLVDRQGRRRSTR